MEKGRDARQPASASYTPAMAKISRKFWFTFPTVKEVQRPVIWEMSRRFPDVVFDIREPLGRKLFYLIQVAAERSSCRKTQLGR